MAAEMDVSWESGEVVGSAAAMGVVPPRKRARTEARDTDTVSDSFGFDDGGGGGGGDREGEGDLGTCEEESDLDTDPGSVWDSDPDPDRFREKEEDRSDYVWGLKRDPGLLRAEEDRSELEFVAVPVPVPVTAPLTVTAPVTVPVPLLREQQQHKEEEVNFSKPYSGDGSDYGLLQLIDTAEAVSFLISKGAPEHLISYVRNSKSPHAHCNSDTEVLLEAMMQGFDSKGWFYDSDPRMVDFYQRLVLEHKEFAYSPREIFDLHCKYETDLEYLEFYPLLFEQVKWSYSTWHGRKKGLKIIANRFSHISERLISRGVADCLDKKQEHRRCKEEYHLCFEIWREVIKKGRDHRDVMREIKERRKYRYHAYRIRETVKGDDFYYDGWMDDYLGGVNSSMSEEEARAAIRTAVEKTRTGRKYYIDYVRKKMDTARLIGIIQ